MQKFKYMNFYRSIFCCLLSGSLLFACSSPPPTEDDDIMSQEEQEEAEHKEEMSNDAIRDIIRKVPSPLEMANIVKKSGVAFSKDMLSDADKVGDYSTNFQKALSLGVYGADLGCINVYEKTHLSMGYVEAVKMLADDLKIGQFFDFVTLERLVNNTKDADSLLYISTMGFASMHGYLNERDRSHLSILILVGGWIESLYIAGNITTMDTTADFYDQYPALVDRIGEQKMILGDILSLLKAYEDLAGFEDLLVQFTELRELYERVKIVYTYHQPDITEETGVLVIQDNSEITVEIEPEHLNNILKKVQLMRTNIMI